MRYLPKPILVGIVTQVCAAFLVSGCNAQPVDCDALIENTVDGLVGGDLDRGEASADLEKHYAKCYDNFQYVQNMVSITWAAGDASRAEEIALQWYRHEGDPKVHRILRFWDDPDE